MNIDAYEIGTPVYVATNNWIDQKPTNYYVFTDAVIDSMIISEKNRKIKIEYWLKTPSGEEWGDTVDSYFVDTNLTRLVYKLKKKIWDHIDDFR